MGSRPHWRLFGKVLLLIGVVLSPPFNETCSVVSTKMIPMTGLGDSPRIMPIVLAVASHCAEGMVDREDFLRWVKTAWSWAVS